MADTELFASNENQVVINAARSRDDGTDAVIATDATGTVVYWNAKAEFLYGWRSEDTLGKNILDVTPTRGSGEAAAQIMEDMRTGTEWDGDFIVKHRNGTPMIARVHNSVVRIGHSIVGVIGVSRRSTRTPPASE
jgi:PAS domain S-box-containing protein